MGTIRVAVLGLGESLQLYDHVLNEFNCTIGVNDIWRAVKTDYVVCVDERCRFTDERLKVIDGCKPLRFYSQLQEWQGRPDYYGITLQEQLPDYVCQLNTKAVPKSLCSPFVAAAIAFKYHEATEIHLYGVDLVSHPNLKDHSVRNIVKHFKALKVALVQNGCTLHVHGNGMLKAL